MMDFYVTGGSLKIAKAAFAKELLRKDSILRRLFFSNRDIKSCPGVSRDDNGNATIDLNFFESEKLTENPGELAQQLKQRYNGDISGSIHFKIVYETMRQEFHQSVKL